MRIFLFLFTLLVAKTLTYSQSDQEFLASKVKNDPTVKIGKLPNGLTNYIKQNPKPANKVELRLVVNAGYILEDEDQLGLAHFMEHMNFNGTKNFKKNDLIDYLESIGLNFEHDLNVYTSFDETVYKLPIPSDDKQKLTKGFQILEDWAHNASLTAKDIDEERDIVLEELRNSKNAQSRVQKKYIPILFYGSKFANRSHTGTENSIKNFTHESLRRFYKDWYRPNLMAVIAVGDIDVAEIESKIKKHFSPIPLPKKARERKKHFLKNHKETFISIESDKELTYSFSAILYKDCENNISSIKTVADYRKNLLKMLFAQMINHRLYELSNKERPPFHEAAVSYENYIRTKQFYLIFAETSNEGQLHALSTLLEEHERIKRYGFIAEELARAKKVLISNLENTYINKDKQESSSFADQYTSHYLRKKTIIDTEWEYKTAIKLLPSIKLYEVSELIKNFLHDDNRIITLISPKKVVTKKEVIGLLKTFKNKKITPYIYKNVTNALMTKRPTAGTIIKTLSNKKLKTKTLLLSNGAKVTYKKTDFKNNEVLFDAFRFGGTSLYSQKEIKAVAHIINDLTQAGINGFSLNELNELLSGKIVEVTPYINRISEGVKGQASPKDLEILFKLIYLNFTSLNHDRKAFTVFKNKKKDYLKNYFSNPINFFFSELSNFKNKDNPNYIKQITSNDIDNSSYDLAYIKYIERFNNANDFHFYFVGNFDENQLINFSKKYIASLPAKRGIKETYKTKKNIPIKGIQTKTIVKGKGPLSIVAINYQGNSPNYNKKEALTLNVITNVIGIKLKEELREKEGKTYYPIAYDSIHQRPHNIYDLYLDFSCAPENVEKLVKLANKQVSEIINNGPTEKNLLKVKQKLLLAYKENLNKNTYWLKELKNLDFFGNDPADILNLEKRINSLTVKDLQEVAKKYLTQGRILGILKPEK